MRPPPGTRFSIFGADVVLQFQKGREAEVTEWLKTWISSFVEPLINIQQANEEARRTAETMAPQYGPPLDPSSVGKTLAEIKQMAGLSAAAKANPNPQIAMCLRCEKHPIAKTSGICNECDAEMLALLKPKASNPETETETKE